MNNSHNKRISIIGCGWLGKALARYLLAQNYNVLGTTRTAEKQATLNTLGIKSELLSLPDLSATLASHPVFNNHIIIIAITPGFKRGETDYADKVRQIVNAAQTNKNTVEQIILLSTTGAYQGLTGKVDETTPLLDEYKDTPNKVALISKAEKAVLAFSELNPSKSASVLRLAGLVGPERHPGRFLSGKSNLPNPNFAVHLIHQQDVVGLVSQLIASPEVTGVFNGVSATKSTRAEFYNRAAEVLSLMSPHFSEPSLEEDKEINGDKIRTALSYQFAHDDLLAWLNHCC